MLIAIGMLLVSLTLPIESWRTGELPTVPLPLEAGRPVETTSGRVWIDTDAACGESRRTDPDDCLAIFLLAHEDRVDIAGISTVFGNAPLTVTDQTTRALIRALQKADRPVAPVHRGASSSLDGGRPAASVPERDAHRMLRETLEEEPLTIVALGPLTNIAATLEHRPHLQANVTRLIAVMGRRRGHVFHPVEGGTAHSLLGHGPIFRDFNFAQDEQAVTAILKMRLPITLIPYEAARHITLDGAMLDRMAAQGGSAAWVAQRAREWLVYWRDDIGREGFYPFDLLAAAYVLDPSFLRCAEVRVAVDDDTWVFGWLGFRGLFVLSTQESASNPMAMAPATYCPDVAEQLPDWLSQRLTGLPGVDRAVRSYAVLTRTRPG